MSLLVLLALLRLSELGHVPRWMVYVMGVVVIFEALTAIWDFANKVLERKLARLAEQRDKILDEAIAHAVSAARTKVARSMGVPPS